VDDLQDTSARSALREAAVLLCRALAHAPHGYAVVDLNGVCVAVTPALARSADEPGVGGFQGRSLVEFAGAVFVPALRAAARRESTSLDVDRLPLSPGARGQYRVTVLPLAGADDASVVGALIEVRDAVGDSERQFRQLVARSPRPICLVRDGLILYANPSAVQAFGGSTAADVVGRQVREFLAVAPGYGDLGLSAAEARGVPALLRAAGGKGTLVALDVWSSPLDDRAVTVVLVGERGTVTESVRHTAPQGERAGSPGGIRPAAGRSGNGQAPMVLVCDDEARLAMLTAGLLDQYGYGSLTVSSVVAALDAIERASPPCDVILLDLTLPDGNAAEVIQKMRASGSVQPVILTSGYAEEDVAPELLSDPLVAGYLAKPYSVERLVEAIAKALEQRR
jgi:CheY-like chemotaxis protein